MQELHHQNICAKESLHSLVTIAGCYLLVGLPLDGDRTHTLPMSVTYTSKPQGNYRYQILLVGSQSIEVSGNEA